jgi:hypothetical protein
VLNRIALPPSRPQIGGPILYALRDKDCAFAGQGCDAVLDGFEERLTKENSGIDAAERWKQEQAAA